MSKSKVIQFPGVRSTTVGAPAGQPEGALAPPAHVPAEPVLRLVDGTPASADQIKAVNMILSGMTFVCIAIEPAKTGADFFTALQGDHDELRNAEQHLPEVIGRLYNRKGVR